MAIISSRLVSLGAFFVMAVWSAGCSSASEPASTPDWHVEGRYEAQAIGKGTRFASITFSPDGTFSLVRANCAAECTNAGRYRLVGGDTLALDYQSGQSEAIPVLPELNVAAAKPANVPKVDLSSDIGVLCGPSDETTPAQFNLSPDKQAKAVCLSGSTPSSPGSADGNPGPDDGSLLTGDPVTLLCEAVAAFGVRDDENKNETVPGVNASGTASLRILADTPAGTTRMQMALTTRSSKPICESTCNKSYGVRINNQDGTRALQRTDKVKALDCRDVCTQVHAPYTIMNDASASSLLPNRRP